MRVVVSVEEHFHRTPNGMVWVQAQFPYAFWSRYLAVFDQVHVAARVRHVDRAPDGFIPASGRAVSFADVPEYLGPEQYLFRLPQIRRALRNVVQPDDAVILMVPSTLGTHIYNGLRRDGRPYGVVVVTDPYQIFAPGAHRHPLRPFFRWLFTRQLREQCANATSASYVTQTALQRRYPVKAAADPSGAVMSFEGRRSYGMTDAILGSEAFVEHPRAPQSAQQTLTLVNVGTFANLSKAPDVLIDAIGICRRAGGDLRLVFVGDGRHRREMEVRAASLGVADRVCFLGRLPLGEAVRDQLDRADVFVLPSRQEGLPRALLEAMARGLPCISTNVGGIPELLSAGDLVPPGDAEALAARIMEIAHDPERRAAMSARNLEHAREYRDDVLQPRRLAFYREVEAATSRWLRQRAACAAKRR
jgi:glycosyltransferase involved in cell wall biosynthesis